MELNKQQVQVLSAALGCAANDPSRPVLETVLVEEWPDGIRFTTTDSYKLARRVIGYTEGEPEVGIVSAAAMRKALGMVNSLTPTPTFGSKRVIEIGVDKLAVRVSAPHMVLSLGHIGGNYPNTARVLPTDLRASDAVTDVPLAPRLAVEHFEGLLKAIGPAPIRRRARVLFYSSHEADLTDGNPSDYLWLVTAAHNDPQLGHFAGAIMGVRV